MIAFQVYFKKFISAPINSMWERTLQDLIRGLRAHADDEAKFVSQCMDECRKELKQSDIDMKAIAVSKLTYVCQSAFMILIC